jgi:hypothetical protein
MKIKSNFEFNILGIENYNSSLRLKNYFKYITDNAHKKDGDIYEFGVFRGGSLLATALLLKKIKSKKKIYGFDSFGGFPSYDKKDHVDNFKKLFKQKKINKKHFLEVLKYKKFIKFLNKKNNPSNISSSGNFSATNINFIKKKIKLLELDNIELVKGDFKKSIKKFEYVNDNINVFASNIDCDLYDGYIESLNFIWKYSKSGTYIHLDEYYSLKFPGAKIATDEFLKNKKNSVINHISKGDDFYRCYIKK